MMISPTVVREARAQFGCPTLQGAPLEDGGGLGSEGEPCYEPPPFATITHSSPLLTPLLLTPLLYSCPTLYFRRSLGGRTIPGRKADPY